MSGNLPVATADPRILLNTPLNTHVPYTPSGPAVEPGLADILIELPVHLSETPRPAALSLRGAAPASGWAVVANPHSSFEEEMEEAGWVLFFMAGEITASALGFNRATALRHALTHLTRKAVARNCNALEITRITCGNFPGLSHVSIGVHLRHLQKGGPLWQTARWETEMA